jgi:multiple sugar transport system ATP-binding protein
VQGRLGDQPLQGVFRERIDTKPGETIRVLPQPGAIHLFDAQSSRRIN